MIMVAAKSHQNTREMSSTERLATGYDSEIVRVRQDQSIAESQLRDYRERLGKSFAHDGYLSELTSLRDHLKAGLSATAHDASNENGPTVSELAERIKALKAANTIEATPDGPTGNCLFRSGAGRCRPRARRAPKARTARLLHVVHHDHDVSIPTLNRCCAGRFAHPEMVLARTS
jgi:hypothetical protein